MNKLPETGYLRIKHILGDKKSNPPITPLIPICRTTWWEGVKSGRFPKPIKLTENVTVWKVEDIRKLINQSE